MDGSRLLFWPFIRQSNADLTLVSGYALVDDGIAPIYEYRIG